MSHAVNPWCGVAFSATGRRSPLRRSYGRALQPSSLMAPTRARLPGALHVRNSPRACGTIRLRVGSHFTVDTPCRYSHGVAASTRALRRTYGGIEGRPERPDNPSRLRDFGTRTSPEPTPCQDRALQKVPVAHHPTPAVSQPLARERRKVLVELRLHRHLDQTLRDGAKKVRKGAETVAGATSSNTSSFVHVGCAPPADV